jgi:hypothetical protein
LLLLRELCRGLGARDLGVHARWLATAAAKLASACARERGSISITSMAFDVGHHGLHRDGSPGSSVMRASEPEMGADSV